MLLPFIFSYLNMKPTSPFFFIACLSLLSALSPLAWADTATASASVSAKPTEMALVSKEALYRQNLGWIVGQQSGIASLGFSEAELNDVAQGLTLAGQGKPAPVNPRDISREMDQYFQKKAEIQGKIIQEQTAKEAGLNRAAAATFFADLKEKNRDNPSFGMLPSGVCYEILTPGNDKKPTMSDAVKVNYTGALTNGHVFDSSYKAGEPVVFAMNGVIPGFSQGLQIIGEKGKARLFIPADQAYGNRRMGDDIPPGSLLVFDIELLEINPEVFQRMGDTVPTTTQPTMDTTAKPGLP